MLKKICTGPLFPISSYSALFIPLKHSFLAKGYQSSNICIIFIKILQIFFPILSASLKIGIQITLCRKMWLLSRSALAQRSSSLLLRSASLSTPLSNSPAFLPISVSGTLKCPLFQLTSSRQTKNDYACANSHEMATHALVSQIFQVK